MMAEEPAARRRVQVAAEGLPIFIGVAKGEDKLQAKVNEIIAAAKKDGDARQDVDEVARPAGRRPAGLSAPDAAHGAG